MKFWGLVLIALLAGATPLLADGGRIRIHEKAGPFLITLFTTPDPLTTGAADFSVAVERADQSGMVEDAEVTLLLTRPDGLRVVQKATHEAATSRFLYAANLALPESGVWQARVNVSQGDQAGECSTSVDVLAQTPLRQQIFWQIVTVPLVVLLFFLHRWRIRWLAGRGRRHL